MPDMTPEGVLGNFLTQENVEGFEPFPRVSDLDKKLNIGFGRNLTDNPFTPDEMNKIQEYMETAGNPIPTLDEQGSGFSQDNPIPRELALMLNEGTVARAMKEARTAFELAEGPTVRTFDGLPLGQKVVLGSMAQNMGQEGLSKFKKMLAAVKEGDTKEALTQFFDSARAGNHPGTPVGRLRLAQEAHMLEHGEPNTDLSPEQLVDKYKSFMPFLVKRKDKK